MYFISYTECTSGEKIPTKKNSLLKVGKNFVGYTEASLKTESKIAL